MSLPQRPKILDAAIEKAGGMRELDRLPGINYQAMQTWRRIPAERMRDIECITGIPREKLHPDIFRQER
jgi:DNA-binding transcriptional regulator YdaS (Cro superfamily)